MDTSTPSLPSALTAPGRSGWEIRPGDRVRRFRWEKTGTNDPQTGRDAVARVPYGRLGTALSCFKQTFCGTFLCTVIWDGDECAAPGHTQAGDLVTVAPESSREKASRVLADPGAASVDDLCQVSAYQHGRLSAAYEFAVSTARVYAGSDEEEARNADATASIQEEQARFDKILSSLREHARRADLLARSRAL